MGKAITKIEDETLLDLADKMVGYSTRTARTHREFWERVRKLYNISEIIKEAADYYLNDISFNSDLLKLTDKEAEKKSSELGEVLKLIEDVAA